VQLVGINKVLSIALLSIDLKLFFHNIGRVAKTGRLTMEERRRLALLVSPEELEECYQLYLLFFGKKADDEDNLPRPTAFNPPGDAHLPDLITGAFSPGDMGVEIEMQMSTDGVATSLGLIPGNGIPWQHFTRNVQPYAVWSAGLSANQASAVHRSINVLFREGKPLPEGWKPLAMRDHQMDSVHASIRLLVAEGPRQGVLIADDVGVGKTATALGVLALMTHCRQTVLDQKSSGEGLENPLRGLLGEKY
jgi:hypothetical protein